MPAWWCGHLIIFGEHGLSTVGHFTTRVLVGGCCCLPINIKYFRDWNTEKTYCVNGTRISQPYEFYWRVHLIVAGSTEAELAVRVLGLPIADVRAGVCIGRDKRYTDACILERSCCSLHWSNSDATFYAHFCATPTSHLAAKQRQSLCYQINKRLPLAAQH